MGVGQTRDGQVPVMVVTNMPFMTVTGPPRIHPVIIFALTSVLTSANKARKNATLLLISVSDVLTSTKKLLFYAVYIQSAWHQFDRSLVDHMQYSIIVSSFFYLL